MLKPSEAFYQNQRIGFVRVASPQIGKFHCSGTNRTGFVDLDDGEVLGLAGVENL